MTEDDAREGQGASAGRCSRQYEEKIDEVADKKTKEIMEQ